MAKLKLEIVYKPTSEIKTHPRNPRVHPESGLVKLSNSIDHLGFYQPIILSSDGILLAGHARLKSATRQKLKEVPTVTVPYKADSEKGRALLLGDNRLPQESGWDEELKIELIGELQDMGGDYTLAGFDESELVAVDDPPEDDDPAGEGDSQPNQSLIVSVGMFLSTIDQSVDENALKSISERFMMEASGQTKKRIATVIALTALKEMVNWEKK